MVVLDCVFPDGELEPVEADTDRPRTIQELARAFDRIGQPVPDEDASLATDPDDYPLV